MINGIMGNQKSRGTVHQIQEPNREIARDALLAESASGGLSRMCAMLLATN